MTDTAPQYLQPEAWFRRPAVLDHGAFVVSLAAVVGEVIHLLGDAAPAPAGGWVALVVVLAGVLVARRRAWAGLAVVLAAAVVAAVSGWEPITLWTIGVFTVFSVTVRGASPLVAGLLTGAVTALSEALVASFELGRPEVTLAAMTSIAGAAAGSAVLSQHRWWRSLEEQTRQAVLTREVEAERRVAEERVRIARDLHDVVGHEVAVVSMHLGLAEVGLPDGADASRRALADARVGVQAVLRETQEILTLLRASGPSADDDDRRPAPGVAALPALLDSFSASGLVIRVQLGELPHHLDVTVDTAVYRIVQEGLTNALKHGAGPVDLSVTASVGAITIDVTNPVHEPGPDRPADRRGLGLVGMTERARSAGGDVVVSRTPDVFRVVATVTMDERSGS
ncbi:histidine kinase [Frigoribacterium sp. CFBP 13707]|uniref:sensor histidine kinase n=1 Tax=Frigoribacterium sp. CFBP 13707 TaxID=2775313 RepID=UPI0017812EEA|nr:histidine kinase [Frigoribacterium sp. CFBP 13707]